MSDIIQVICGELTTSFDNEVMKAVRKVGINVNKEELIKALELADKLVPCTECKWENHCMRCVEQWNFHGDEVVGRALSIRFCSEGERKDGE